MSRRAAVGLSVCMLLVLAYSMIHVSESVGMLSTDPRTGWLAAGAVDAGLAMLMWLIVEGEVRIARRWAVGGVALMAYMSMFANADAVLAVIVKQAGASAVLVAIHDSAFWQIVRWLTFSVPIPALVIVVAAVLHLDHAELVAVAAPKRERRARAGLREPAVWPHDELLGEWTTVDPIPPVLPTADAVRLAHVRAHVAAHPLATDTDVHGATGVPRSTVGRWRRAGMLTPAAAEHSLNGKVSG